MEVAIQIDEASLQRLDRFLKEYPKKARTALQRAVNRAAQRGATVAKRAISKELGIKQSDLTKPHRFGAHRVGDSVGKAIDVIKAGKDKYEAIVRISGRRIPVVFFKGAIASGVKSHNEKAGQMYFGVGRYKGRFAKGGQGAGSGVQWKIGKNVTRVRTAFIATMPSGHTGIFGRKTKVAAKVGPRGGKREKLFEYLGPSIPYVAEHNYEFGTSLSLDVHPLMEAELHRQLDLIERQNG